MAAVHHAHLQHKVGDDLCKMQQEGIDLHLKMLKEDSEHFCSSDTVFEHLGKTETPMWNAETWKGVARPEVPLKACMLQLPSRILMGF